MRIICGVCVRVEGLENLPKDAGGIIACKHQSTWETIYLLKILRNPAVVLKKELTYIPVYGWYLILMGMIIIDRKAGKAAIEKLASGIERAIKQKRYVTIFPEGTRTKPGMMVDYKPGISVIHNALPDYPIIPVALNSGLIWPAKSFLIAPGTITIKFLKPIKGRSSKAELLSKLHDVIETESKKLLTRA